MDVKNIGSFLRQSRINKKLTQANIADMLGISPQAISKWERGENMPDISFFADISKIYEISLEEIINGKKEDDEKESEFKKNFFDSEFFENIMSKIENSKLISSININLDFFAYLGNEQKIEFIESILNKKDYMVVLDEILPYTNKFHRNIIINHILENKDYQLLEDIIIYMNNKLKDIVLLKLLNENKLEIIEEIITIFNKSQREQILEYFIENKMEFEIIENFLPFFNQNQIERIKKEFLIWKYSKSMYLH